MCAHLVYLFMIGDGKLLITEIFKYLELFLLKDDGIDRNILYRIQEEWLK